MSRENKKETYYRVEYVGATNTHHYYYVPVSAVDKLCHGDRGRRQALLALFREGTGLTDDDVVHAEYDGVFDIEGQLADVWQPPKSPPPNPASRLTLRGQLAQVAADAVLALEDVAHDTAGAAERVGVGVVKRALAWSPVLAALTEKAMEQAQSVKSWESIFEETLRGRRCAPYDRQSNESPESASELRFEECQLRPDRSIVLTQAVIDWLDLRVGSRVYFDCPSRSTAVQVLNADEYEAELRATGPAQEVSEPVAHLRANRSVTLPQTIIDRLQLNLGDPVHFDDSPQGVRVLTQRQVDVLQERHAEMPPPAPRTPYDPMYFTTVLPLEEAVANLLANDPDIELRDESITQEIASTLVYTVLREVRPDMFETE